MMALVDLLMARCMLEKKVCPSMDSLVVSPLSLGVLQSLLSLESSLSLLSFNSKVRSSGFESRCQEDSELFNSS